MSLSSIIKRPLRYKFKKTFKKPSSLSTLLDTKPELLAPPLTENFALVGIAFDYLVRFWLKRKYKNKVEERTWIGEQYARHLIDGSIELNIYEKIRGIVSGRLVWINTGKSLKTIRVRDEFHKAKSNYYRYLSEDESKIDGILDNVIESCLFLATMEIGYRSSKVDLQVTDPNDIQDLRNLFSIWCQQNFDIKRQAFLNPTFGRASSLVNGADADLIADDTLIDFKVYKDFKLDPFYFYQIIGYYLLSEIGGVNDQAALLPIRKIGIYFARYGKLWIIPVSDLASEEKMICFKNWFHKWLIGGRTPCPACGTLKSPRSKQCINCHLASVRRNSRS